MQEIQAPQPIPNEGRKLFLAGSIEMNRAHEWQQDVVGRLAETDWVILNPRRGSWDSSWEQNINNEEFKKQVEWELSALERADKILMYFDPQTKSPISLLELGLFARSGKLVVVCPEGFWRKGNVDIVCERYGIVQVETIELALERLS
ncbi:MAG: nucleoside 2-deoxyribosyltransferase domain-containing protein [Patescibacteria group bacterium]|jgi:hypothetical protein